jgi:hypothetical protein
MKLIFIKNYSKNLISNVIFKHILNSKFKNNTKIFIKDFVSICNELNLGKQYLVDKINLVSKNFKE